MNSLNVSLLVHTFNEYEKFWKGCEIAWSNHNIIIEKYWGTDFRSDADKIQGFTTIYSGKSEWSNRLIALLHQIPTEYILYCQEDMWPTQQPPDLSEMMKIVSEKHILRLQLSPIVQFYSLSGSELPLFFHPSSKYLVSHQPSIWKKDFLLSCLEEGEDPWRNEYAGSLRLLNDPKIQNKIAIWPCDWFKHVGIKGELHA